MIKVRGQVAEIAIRIQDPVERIRDLAMLFFHELAKRGNNPVYNLLPDTIGQLSLNDKVSDEDFRVIIKFLFNFISKDKHTESLVEKLCARFLT